ncbi:MAG: aldo/keto reductase [Dehalococcoidales bacterium]|nr:aldo/keto reductase [Dehalococcoidales bacterium]
MEYRSLGRTGLRVSALGLGTEYLINLPREHVVSVVHDAIARGINYFDLFFAQPAFRDNAGAAFRGYREKVLLTAHLGSVDRDGQYDKSRNPAEAGPYFADYLTRYQTDHVDVLFIHNIDEQADYDRVMGPGGLLEMAKTLRGEGKARAIGFSGHTAATAMQAVLSGQVDVLMFPINLAGHAMPGKKELFSACAERGVGLVAMKPFAGGRLLREDRTLVFNKVQVAGTPREIERKAWITPSQCLAYVHAQPGVSTVVPGCKDREQLAAAVVALTASEAEKDFAPVMADFAQYVEGECVYCNHCLPCPSYIDIGRTMRLLDSVVVRPTPKQLRAYKAQSPSPADCIECGACSERCPFGVDPMNKVEETAALFEALL